MSKDTSADEVKTTSSDGQSRAVVADAPKGEVVIGERAGAFGPWRAHLLLDKIAETLTKDVRAALDGVPGRRVLVVDGQPLLAGTSSARHVHTELNRLKTGLVGLEGRLQGEEERLALVQGEDTDAGGSEVRRSATATTALPLGAVLSPVGAAVDLFGLLRTDWSVTAAQVTAAPTGLTVLTAGHLAGPSLDVETDGLAMPRESAIHKLLSEVLGARHDALDTLVSVQARLTPIESELASGSTRLTALEEAWTSAMAESKADENIQELGALVQSLALRTSRLARVAGPATAEVAHARLTIAEADSALQALLQTPDGGESPLLTAVRWERLGLPVDAENGSARPITHVLSVGLDVLTADLLTRRSVLGASGQLRVVSAGNASWLLHELSSGTIVSGGQVSLADAATFSLGSADGSSTTGEEWRRADAGDPWVKLEKWLKGVVAFLVVMLGALAVLSMIALFRTVAG